MRKTLLTCAVLAAACTTSENNSEAPPAPEVPTTAPELTTTTGQPDATTTTEPATTTPTAYDWGPVLCPELGHPRHHEPCPKVSVTAPPTTAGYLREQATTVPAARSTSSGLASIRACESGNNYTTDTGNGYYGAYQFAWSTWASVGGTGNPAHASPAEQDMRAQMMIDQGRRGEWPNC